ncbi:GFA family protein [Rhodobacter capsulatus]|uniref:GFA family protein n=1 Tax=Rhodobacter capsulatus TaxID=1061 RepID=UPI0024B590BE|nr:GFA family protein [Rhodobacter capsulatus]
MLARRLRGTRAEGGCACGALRDHILQSPRDLTECFCPLCRRSSGATRLAWGTVDREAFILSGSGLATHASSPACRRGFCMRCGTHLTFADASRPQEIDFTLASLDAPEAHVPGTALHVADRLAWDPPSPGRLSYSAARGSALLPDTPQGPGPNKSKHHDA